MGFSVSLGAGKPSEQTGFCCWWKALVSLLFNLYSPVAGAGPQELGAACAQARQSPSCAGWGGGEVTSPVFGVLERAQARPAGGRALPGLCRAQRVIFYKAATGEGMKYGEAVWSFFNAL